MDERFEVDAFALDREWVRQPRLVRQAAEDYALASKAHAEAEEELDRVRAELDKEVRLHPGKYGVEKVTEAVVANTILLQPSYKLAMKVVIESKHECDLLKGDLNALEHKKRALEYLVQLHSMDYFAEPRQRQGQGQVLSEMNQSEIASRHGRGRRDQS